MRWVCNVLAEDNEVAIIGDENEPVFSPIAADLFAFGGDPRVVFGWFDFDDAARGILRGRGFLTFSFLKLIFGEEPIGLPAPRFLSWRIQWTLGLRDLPISLKKLDSAS